VVKKYSVVIPTFNRATLLPRAIESVLAQTFLPSEIIVVDDGSTDNTKELVLNYPQVTYIYKENRGVSSARNEGIRRAKFEYIAFLDSDDTWHSEKMYSQLQSDALVSYTDEVWIRDKQSIKIPKKFRKNSPTTFESEIHFCNIAPSSVVIHRKVFEKVGIFDTSLEVCEDYDLWLRILLHFEIELCDTKLITKYAGHEDQLSFKHWGMDRFRMQSLEKIFTQNGSNNILLETIIQKCTILMESFSKHKRLDEEIFYKNKIQFYKNMKKREQR